MADYDSFAWFYNRYWNGDFHSAALPVLERIWLAKLKPGARLLDICCGTGYLADILTRQGYQVTGIDTSEEMISLARASVPGAEFDVADARQFQFPRKFDGAVSTFDSVNHLLTVEDLSAMFRHTAQALKRGGAFAFDALLKDGYQTHWGENFSIVRDDHVLTITGGSFDARSRIAQCHITMFRLMDGVWQRFDASVRERCYAPAEIDEALAAAGFGQTVCYAARDLGLDGEIGAGRTFYVTRRL
jgi:SAM-dependent methyltransferase